MTSNRSSGHLEIDGGRIYYEAAGEGETVVLVHAGIVDSDMWDAQFDELAEHYRVVRYDQRGFGRSDVASGPMSRPDELGAVLAKLGIETAALVGCSQGGTAALDFAITHPEQVWALVLVSATPSGFEMQGEPPAALMELFGALQQGELERATELQMRVSIDGELRKPEQVDAAVRQRAAEMNRIAVQNGTAAIADMEPLNPLDPPAVARLADVNIPTLAITGALDHAEIARAAEVMAAQIPRGQKEMLDDAAHLPNMERPLEFNRLVLGFLRYAQASRGEGV